MKIRGYISSFLVVSHLVIMLWYYSHTDYWQVENKQLAQIMFFGISFILIGLNLFLSCMRNNLPIQFELTKFHSIFIMLLGTIYLLHYSGLMITNNEEKLKLICYGASISFLITFISAVRHKFFKPESYYGQ